METCHRRSGMLRFAVKSPLEMKHGYDNHTNQSSTAAESESALAASQRAPELSVRVTLFRGPYPFTALDPRHTAGSE